MDLYIGSADLGTVCLGGGGLSKLLFWDNRCLNLLIGVELSGDPRGAAFDPAILAIYGQK